MGLSISLKPLAKSCKGLPGPVWGGSQGSRVPEAGAVATSSATVRGRGAQQMAAPAVQRKTKPGEEPQARAPEPSGGSPWRPSREQSGDFFRDKWMNMQQ